MDRTKVEHKFNLGMNRQASVIVETTEKPKKEAESQPVWWLKKDESYQVLVEEEDGDDGFISYNSKQQQDASEISSLQQDVDFFETSEKNLPQMMKQSGRKSHRQQKTKFIRAKGGGKIPLRNIDELDEEEKM